ncbi:fatty acid synthase [Halyomorpha halys]|uniref:fatty acid synthase n=1 Tax=Halyomorpha halys TaxID=286706 RepID=UPI0006D50D63|nr:fatty acid synthase-like [Halyomorpha halys]
MGLTPQETMVSMPSGAKEDGRPLFVVHPIEGVVTELEDLTSLLPFRVYGFQCTTDVPDDSVDSMASTYLKLMKDVKTTDTILLLGYSFGASVAFEMALRLEAEGRKVHLFLIDGSPDFVRKRTSLYRAKITDADESDAFSYYITLFKTIDHNEYQKIQQEFKALPDMEARLTHCAKKLEGEGDSEDDIKKAALTFYNKVLAAEKYYPSAVFTGKVLLLKADQNFVAAEKDYGLKKLCKEVPEVYTYKTTHKEIIKIPTVKKIVNRIINAINP